MNREIMEQMGFKKEMKKIENQQCPFCNTKINVNEFENDLSLREFTISGLCQKCQNKIFKRKS